MAETGLWNIAKKRMLEERGALPTEEGDLVRYYKAIHDENVLSSRLREDVEGKAEGIEKVNSEAKEEESTRG